MAIFGIAIGVMVFIGFMAFQAVFLIPMPCTSSSCPTVSPDQAAYAGVIHALAWTGAVALDLSVGLSVTFAFVVSSRNDLPESTRRAAFYFATIYLAAFTVFGLVFLTGLLSFIRYL